MEHQNNIKPGFIIFAVFFALIFFYSSCASQKEPDEATETLAEAAKPESPATDDAALSDLKEITKSPDETKPLEEKPAGATPSADLAIKDPKTETPPTEVPNAVPLTNTATTMTPLPESTDKAADKLINDSSVDGKAVAEGETPKEGAAGLVIAEDTEKNSELKEEKAPPVKKNRRKPKKLAKMVLPEIPTEAIAQNGIFLNRFYFFRKGDSPEKVSDLLYGTPTKSADLMSWNSKEWKPGQVIFYNSPLQPQDREMKSFFQERNVPPERYQLRRGDTLARLAKQKLGSAESWTELAVVNGLSGPKDAEPGQTLALYPADLSSYTFKPPEIPKPVPTPVPIDTPAPVAENPDPPKEIAPPVAEAPKKEKIEKKTEGSLDIGKLVEQNLIAVLIGAGVIVLGLSYRIAKKKGKNSGGGNDDYGDDDSAPTQAKRR